MLDQSVGDLIYELLERGGRLQLMSFTNVLTAEPFLVVVARGQLAKDIEAAADKLATAGGHELIRNEFDKTNDN